MIVGTYVTLVQALCFYPVKQIVDIKCGIMDLANICSIFAHVSTVRTSG